MRSSTWTTLMLVALTAMLMTSIGSIKIDVEAVKCEDATGIYKWKDTGHGDNKATESRFEKIADDTETTPCKLAKAIDHEKVEFEMSEDEFTEKFIKLPLWQDTDDDQKICMAERADLGNTFKDYEAQHCITKEY